MVFDIRAVIEHLTFGRDVLAVNLISFLTRSIDNLVIGKVLGSRSGGAYSMAFQFARLPGMLVSGPLQFVFYSKMARVKEDKAALRSTFLVLTRILATVIFPTMGMIAVAYHPAFTLLLSDKWASSGKIFMLVASGMSVQAVMGICGTIRMVLGRTDVLLRTTVELGILWITTMLIMIWFGLDWLAFSYSLVSALYAPRILMLALPLIDCPASTYARAITVPVMITLACICAYLGLQNVLCLATLRSWLWPQCLS